MNKFVTIPETEYRELNEKVRTLSDELDKERWQHAACLSIAEGCPGWDQQCWAESCAIKAVRYLRQRYEELRNEIHDLHQTVEKSACGGSSLSSLMLVWNAMKLLGINSIQTCPECDQKWVNLNDRTCRECGHSLGHVVGGETN